MFTYILQGAFSDPEVILKNMGKIATYQKHTKHKTKQNNVWTVRII